MEPMNIRQKLWYIQQNLNVSKNQYNQYGDFRYRSCEDIQEAVKPILKEVKAVLLVGDEAIQIGDRFYVKATAALQDIESPEQITNTTYAREPDNKPKMDTAQLTGSCATPGNIESNAGRLSAGKNGRKPYKGIFYRVIG